MKRNITFLIINGFCLLIFTAIINGQKADQVISYFAKKGTPTVYFTKKAIKQNVPLQTELIKTDKSFDGYLRNFVVKVQNSPAMILPPPPGTIQTRIKTSKATGMHYDYNQEKTMAYDYRKKIKTGETIDNGNKSDSNLFISLDIENKNTGNFLANYCAREIDSGNIYVETGIEICQLGLPASTSFANGSSGLETLDADLIREVQKIDTQKVRDFFFFDTFVFPPTGLSHGQSVKNIIEYTLSSFGAAKLIPKVKPVSVDFFDKKVRPEALKLIENYLTTKYGNSEIIEPLNIKKEYYKNIDAGNCTGICMPSDYLNILLDNYLMKNPEVISMSFYMKTIFPIMCFAIKPSMYTNLFGAVLNDRGIIEDLEADISGSAFEPMFTLKSNIPSTGTLLIGAESQAGKYDCLYSDGGSNVSALGNGNWKSAFNNAPEKYGTSWATPEIATKLFIAKAYWKSLGFNISSIEAKHRLLLSCDLDTNYVSRFASAGIPNINKLLRKNSGGFIEKGDTIYDIELKGNPKIIIYQKNGDQILFNFKKGDNHNYLRGLYFKDNALFVYQEIRLKWEKVEGFDIKSQYSVEFKDFNLKIQKTNSSVRISSLRDLEINHINQIVCL